VKKNLLSYFFCSHKFHKIEYYVIFEMLKKKIWANFQRIVEVFTQKIFNMLSNIWVWDPGSEIRDPEKTYFGSRIQGSKRHKIPDSGSRIQSRNTGCEGKKLTHLVSWFVSLLDMLWRTRFSVSLVSSSIFSWNSREQSILVWNFSVFICRRFQMLLKFVCPGRWKARPNIFIAIKINQSS
jgi:hypothetical protein